VDKIRPHVRCQAGHRHIVGRGQRGETANAFPAGALRQLSDQYGAKSPALPFVHDGDGNLGGLRIVSGPDITSDAHPAPVSVIHRAERLMVVMVNLGEIAQLRRGQFPLRRQKPRLTRSGTQPGEPVGQQRGVSALNLPYQHLRPVAQRYGPALHRGPRLVTEQAAPVGPQPARYPAERRSRGNGCAGRQREGRLRGV
jgi:hypothetical protein